MTAQQHMASPYGAGFAPLPEECPLLMPQQSLWQRRGRARSPGTASRTVPLRRLFVFATSIAMTMAAAYEMYQVLKIAGLTIPEGVVLVLFVFLFAWIALSFVSAVVGFLAVLWGPNRALDIDAAAPLPAVSSQTALLLPTYNEDAARVMARLQAVYESVCATGYGDHFDCYILSDTADPAIWIAEEAAFLRLRERTRSDRVFYRHRIRNIGRKAGNIAEWVTRFGGRYDHMIVLDADSLMEGDTVVRLVAAMERHPCVGLIQTLPALLNGTTLFERIQQFAGRVYGPLIARGIGWWHGAESNYWGHNAIIRVQAFAEQAGLPLLSGRKPFGGHILSHDFVEAGLLRRAGWGVHLAPSLGGSYEECPPTLTDYLARDRRWCQGNLQHVGVLPARGLHWVSRLHLMTGIGSYITAPMWLTFLLVGILISLQAQFIRPEYFPSGASLFPQWPAQDPERATWVFAGTMGLLIAPKMLGYLAALVRARDRSGMGGGLRGLLSVLLETVISALIAPTMMLMQSKAVAEILIGRDAGWQTQRRGEGGAQRTDLLRPYVWPTVLGIALAAGAYAVSIPLLLWMSPVVAGLILAVPIAAMTSQPGIGKRLRTLGLLLTAEERAPPPVLSRANELALAEPAEPVLDPIARLAQDAALLDAHARMLPPPQPRRRGDVDVTLVVALAKIEEAGDLGEAIAMLSAKETLAVLATRQALAQLLAKSGRFAPAMRDLDVAVRPSPELVVTGA
jgi:membrane glycosyltransferase